MNHLMTRFAIVSLALLMSGCLPSQGTTQTSGQTGFADRTEQFGQPSNSNFNARENRAHKLADRFKQFDQNSDGIITPDELNRPKLFQRLDQNNDGSVTLEEARSHLQSQRQAYRNNGSSDNPGSTINPLSSSTQTDSDINATLSMDGGVQPMPQRTNRDYENGNRGSKLTERFKKFDQNGDNVLSTDELKRPELFRRLDQNNDGLITLEEARSHRNNRRQLAYNSTNAATDISADATNWAPSNVTDARTYSKNNARGLSASDSAFTQYPNIRYAEISGVDPNLLSLDVYAPKTGQNHPVIVMVHGGGWQRGDKANANVVANKARYFTGTGYIFVSINYRLSPGFKHPTPAQDVAKAIAWTYNHIGRYGGNSERIYLMGHSAGAHLAALVATDQRYLQATGKNLQLLKGVILLDGAGYDIPRLMREHNQPNIYVAAFGKDERTWKDASPITHIASGKNIPPFLIFYTPRPRAQMLSENLRESLSRAGVNVRSKMLNKSHKQINQEIGNSSDEATQIIMDFLTNNSN